MISSGRYKRDKRSLSPSSSSISGSESKDEVFINGNPSFLLP